MTTHWDLKLQWTESQITCDQTNVLYISKFRKYEILPPNNENIHSSTNGMSNHWGSHEQNSPIFELFAAHLNTVVLYKSDQPSKLVSAIAKACIALMIAGLKSIINVFASTCSR